MKKIICILIFINSYFVFGQFSDCQKMPELISTGIGDGSMQIYVPMIHSFSENEIIFSNAIHEENNEDIVLTIISIENKWNCNDETGIIIIDFLNDEMNLKGKYIVDFEKDEPIISFQYENSELIIFSDVHIYKKLDYPINDSQKINK